MDSKPAVVDVTDATFATDVVEASKQRPVVVDFWASWCAPCMALGPIIEEAVERHGGVTLAKLDVDANPHTAAAFGIRGIPAVKGFRDGRVVAEFVGLQQKREVERFLTQVAPARAVALPADEAELRLLLEAHADNVAARRALGRLLLDAGNLDEAAAILAEAHDAIADGLRARIELQRDGHDVRALLGGKGNDTLAVRDVIAAIRNSTDPTRSRLRRVAVGILESDSAHPAVQALRGELASALF